MSTELLMLALAVAVAAYVLLARWSRSRRRALGIAEGAIVSADDSLIRGPTLRSERLGLVGRCDHLLRVGDAYVPVEQKPTARRVQQSHILPVGALCLLVHDVYGARPPYGVVVLGNGSQQRITYSEELERGVVQTMAKMRRILATGMPPGPRWLEAKCRACGYFPVCWDDDQPAGRRSDDAPGAGEECH
ncbi:MAG: CRISPR-associated protein Cas4 [Chloroflexota bacterium]